MRCASNWKHYLMIGLFNSALPLPAVRLRGEDLVRIDALDTERYGAGLGYFGHCVVDPYTADA